MARRPGDCVDVEVFGSLSALGVAVEILLGAALDPVPVAEDVGDGLRFDLAHAVLDLEPVLDAELLVAAQVSEEKMPQLVRQCHEGHGGDVIAVETQLVDGIGLLVFGAGQTADESRIAVALIVGFGADFFLFEELLESRDALLVDLSFGIERESIVGEGRAFGIEHIVNEGDGTEGPHDEKGARFLLHRTLEPVLPVVGGRGVVEAGFLDLEKHGVERGHVPQTDGEIEKRLVFATGVVEPGVDQQLVEKVALVVVIRGRVGLGGGGYGGGAHGVLKPKSTINSNSFRETGVTATRG